jgi:predicted RNA polymerase sigma factor
MTSSRLCCGANISMANRIPLILKTLCGLSGPAVARALLTTESTISTIV